MSTDIVTIGGVWPAGTIVEIPVVASRLTAAKVTVSRNHPADVRERQVYARIDDAPMQTLVFGDVITFDVLPGSHQLRANNTLFWKRVDFSIEPGEHIEFVLINRLIWARFEAMGFFVGGVPLKLVIERR